MIANEIKDYINTLDLYAVATLDILEDEEQAICLQQLPGSPKTKRSFGASEGEISFRILAKHNKKMSAADQLETICDHFYNNKNIQLTERTTLEVEVTSTPTLLEYTGKKSFIYQAQYKLRYKQKGAL